MALTGREAEVDGGEDIQIVARLECGVALYLPIGVGVLHTQPPAEVPLGRERLGNVRVEGIDVLVEEDGIGARAEGRVGEVFVVVVCAAPGTLCPEGKDRLP